MDNTINNTISIGYITVSDQVMKQHKPVGYFYRDTPLEPADSGWCFFSGDESKAYCDNADNFSLYNASTLIDKFPALAAHLHHDFPIAFERQGDRYVQVNQ